MSTFKYQDKDNKDIETTFFQWVTENGSPDDLNVHNAANGPTPEFKQLLQKYIVAVGAVTVTEYDDDGKVISSTSTDFTPDTK